MKKAFLLVFGLFTFLSFAQNINQYEFVIVPTQFGFQKNENEYRLNTLAKFRLQEYGFTAFYTSEKPYISYEERCSYLKMNVISESGMFVTKFYIEFKDCNDKLVFKSVTGSSRNKDRQAANTEALEEALLSVKDLNYKFEGNSTESVIESTEVIQSVPVVKSVVVSEKLLFAQPIENGFQIVDKTPRVVLKMYKTTEKDYFIATSESKNGVLFKKNNEWFFEYYLNEKLVSEKLSIKF